MTQYCQVTLNLTLTLTPILTRLYCQDSRVQLQWAVRDLPGLTGHLEA